MQNNSKGKSIAALVCGILAIIFSFVPYAVYVAPILGIVGIVLGALGMKSADPSGKGMAVAGLVCGIIGTVISVILWACAICIVCSAAQTLNSWASMY